jgi:transketolase
MGKAVKPKTGSPGGAKGQVKQDRVSRLTEIARQIRIDIVRMTYDAGPARKGHPGGALSATDIVAALFFDFMRLDPAKPKWPDRDRFILSKGHACPVLYAALANRGYFSKEAFASFRKVDGMLQGHPDMKGTPGVDMTAGSLGHGLSAGVGMAIAAKIDKRDYKVFVLLSDGECQEGLIWEAAMIAPKYKLDNLIAIVDVNRLQSSDWVEAILPLEPLAAKWMAFGWNVMEIDGHDMRQVVSALELAVHHKGKPTVILAQTVKGKGVSYMEDDNDWHQKAPDKKQFEQAMSELQGGEDKDV